MIKYSLILFCFGLFLFSCNKNKKPENSEHAEVLKYLGSEKNYKNKKQYINYFDTEYHTYIKEMDYPKAAAALVKYGELIKSLKVGDSVILKQMKIFVKADYLKKDDTVKANINMLIAKQLQQEIQIDSAIIYAKKAIKISEKYPESVVYLNSNNVLAVNYSFQNQFEKAISILTNIIKIAEKKNNHALLGAFNSNLASCHDSFYAYKESEKFYKKAGREFLLAKDTASYLQSQAVYLINNFSEESDTLKTLALISETNRIFEKFSRPSDMERAVMNDFKALKYQLKKNYDSALYYNQASKEYFEKLNNNIILEYNIITEAQLLFYKNGYLKDKKNISKLAESSYKNEDFETSKSMYNLLYQDALKNKNYEEAIKYRDLEVKSDEII